MCWRCCRRRSDRLNKPQACPAALYLVPAALCGGAWLAKPTKSDNLIAMSAAEDIKTSESHVLLTHLAALPPLLQDMRAALASPLPHGADQFCAHGRAGAASYVEPVQQVVEFAETVSAGGRCGAMEDLTLIIVGQ